MSHLNQEDMVVLHKLPRSLHYKTFVDLPFSKTLNADLDCESFIRPFCCYFSFAYANRAFPFLSDNGKI